MDLQIERTGDTKAYDGCRQYPSAIGQLIQVERLIAGHVQVGVYGGKINAVSQRIFPLPLKPIILARITTGLVSSNPGLSDSAS